MRVIKAIHGVHGLLNSDIRPNQHSVWIDIIRASYALRQKSIDLLSYCKKSIGNGVNILFWLDVWVGDMLIKDRFPRLFGLESNKEVSVAVKYISNLIVDSFHHPCLGGAESVQLAGLTSILSLISLNSNPDKWFNGFGI